MLPKFLGFGVVGIDNDPMFLDFDQPILESVIGGQSAIGIKRLNIKTVEAAGSFLSSYGFNPEDHKDIEKLWYYHRRSLVLMNEKLGLNLEDIPAELKDRKLLGDIRKIIVYANSDDPVLQKWACAFLRCIHVFVHAENDLFSTFSEAIQAQILGPFQDAIVNDGTAHKTFLKSQIEGLPDVELLGFEVKPFKTSSSTVIKLLAKPDAIAMKIFDKLGVRFVTKNLFDSFQVVRFLVEHSIISFPHVMPDQSSNNVFPIDLFMKACDEVKKDIRQPTDQLLTQQLEKVFLEAGADLKYLRKENFFSGQDYRFIKFITRKLVKIPPSGPNQEPFSFFYPFEVQIMDESAQKISMSGPSEHQAYKERQRAAAKARLFPED